MKRKFYLLFVGMIFLMLLGCGKTESQKAFEENFKYIQTILLQRGDLAGEESAEKSVSRLFEKSSFKINKVKEKKETSQIDVTIKAVNMGMYIPQYMSAVMPLAFAGMSEQSLNIFAKKFFEDLLNLPELSYVEENIVVNMEKVDGKWIVKNEDELKSAMFGGIDKAFNDVK